jgi:hypothetical protein
VRYGLDYYCKEHSGAIHVYGNVDHAHEAIYYLILVTPPGLRSPRKRIL